LATVTEKPPVHGNSTGLVDSHCHLPLIQNEAGDTQTIIERALLSGVEHMLCVCVDLETFDQILDISEKNGTVSGTVGTHPNNEQGNKKPSVEDLISRGNNQTIVAVGETGLDYFYGKDNISLQKEILRTHIEAAKSLRKPLIIHCRESASDIIDILHSENARDVGGIMHCFVESWEVAKQALDLGFYISFSGIVTFKNAGDLREVATKIPSDKLLVETDSPWLAPIPHRGKQNEPSYLHFTAQCLANIRRTPIQDFAEITTSNFYRLFPDSKKSGPLLSDTI
jgi:TatD DNase family protein